MKRIPTIKEVAASAKVSTATVSNVIHGKDALYSPDTAQAVWHAVHTLGYRPNRVARSLVRQRTDTLGVVIDRPHGRLTRNPYMSALLDGFLDYAVNVGFQIKLISLLMEDRSGALSQLDDGTVDGFALFAPPDGSPLMEWALQVRVPIVLAGSAPEDLEFACVAMDDEEAGYQATRWLIELGHERVGLISGPFEQWSARRREAGYRRAMQKARLSIHEDWCRSVDYLSESAETAAIALVKVCPRPTAILCWNDGMALGALTAVQQYGLRVPEDISLVGFDDSEAARWVQPGLTSVGQPVSEIGHKAAEILIRQIETGVREEGHTLFHGTLVIRQSVVSLKGGEITPGIKHF